MVAAAVPVAVHLELLAAAVAVVADVTFVVKLHPYPVQPAAAGAVAVAAPCAVVISVQAGKHQAHPSGMSWWGNWNAVLLSAELHWQSQDHPYHLLLFGHAPEFAVSLG